MKFDRGMRVTGTPASGIKERPARREVSQLFFLLMVTLPTELIEAIASHVDDAETQWACMHLGRTWSAILRPKFYRKVRITSKRQLDRFLNSMTASAHYGWDAGLNVRELTIKNVFHITCQDAYRLPALLPKIKRADMYDRLWTTLWIVGYFLRSGWLRVPIRAAKLSPHQLPPWFAFDDKQARPSMSSQLRELDVKCSVDTLLAMLSHAPRLEVLSARKIRSEAGFLSADEFEHIDTMCPYLHSLTLQGFWFVSMNFNDMGFNGVPENDVAHASLAYPINRTLKRLTFKNIYLSPYELMTYFANKYRAVEYLDLNNIHCRGTDYDQPFHVAWTLIRNAWHDLHWARIKDFALQGRQFNYEDVLIQLTQMKSLRHIEIGGRRTRPEKTILHFNSLDFSPLNIETVTVSDVLMRFPDDWHDFPKENVVGFKMRRLRDTPPNPTDVKITDHWAIEDVHNRGPFMKA